MPAASSATIALTASPSAGICRNTAASPATSATTSPANSIPPQALKLRLLFNAHADSANVAIPVVPSAIATTCAPPDHDSVLAITGPIA